MNRRIFVVASGATLLLGACPKPGLYTSDCGAHGFPMRPTKSKLTAVAGGPAGSLQGTVRETGRHGPPVRKALVLFPGRADDDTLRVAADSLGLFRATGLAPGRRKMIVRARWYWDAIDSVDVRPDSGLRADVVLEPIPLGWHSCIPH